MEARIRAEIVAEENGGNGMAGALRAKREAIRVVRAQIADAYAESLGSAPECRMQ